MLATPLVGLDRLFDKLPLVGGAAGSLDSIPTGLNPFAVDGSAIPHFHPFRGDALVFTNRYKQNAGSRFPVQGRRSHDQLCKSAILLTRNIIADKL